MFRFLARMIGLVLVAGALVAGIADASRSMAANAIVLTPLGQTWFSLHPASLNLTQVGLERHVWPPLWDPVLLTILEQPTWLPLLVLGAIFLLIGTRSRQRDPFEES